MYCSFLCFLFNRVKYLSNLKELCEKKITGKLNTSANVYTIVKKESVKTNSTLKVRFQCNLLPWCIVAPNLSKKRTEIIYVKGLYRGFPCHRNYV